MPGKNLTKPRLRQKYEEVIIPLLQKEFKIKNKMAAPKIIKININMGIGDISHDKTAIEKAITTLSVICGQKPAIRKAKKAIAEFKIRQGNIVGLVCTLRGRRMYQFLDKLLTVVLPRVRDFQGVKRTSFDGSGNYTLALREQIIFPEVNYDKIDKVRGLEISFISSIKEDQKTARLLELMGMPFEKGVKNG